MGGHINKRELSKNNTRKHILQVTEQLIKENGLLKVSTKDISNAANVAQGSIFLHFKTKKILFFNIFSKKIDVVEKQLHQKCSLQIKPEDFLRNFLDVFIEHEGLLSRMVKDYAYMQTDLKTKIDNLENEIKNILFDYLRKHNINNHSIVNSFIVIDAFYAQIKEYLKEKTVYSEQNEFLKQKLGRLNKLSKILFGF
ncbi:MAG: TetR/AcrR family transcriptional regulator [Candidatus Izimaplasma sp.]|nr:TetR/AcrR family transcriptional regulator [Candidatus Izimaplasma bacterium]